MNFEKPFIVFWEVTRACLLACKHCRAKAQTKPHPDELKLEESYDLIDQLRRWNPLLIITGGDPLMRKNLFDILEYLDGMRVAIAFSGTKLATKDKLKKMHDLGVSRIAVSIDGSNAKIHDHFRGRTGTFEMSLKILDMAREIGISTQINTTVTKHNIFDLPNIMKLCLEKGVDMWDVFFVVPTGRAKPELMPSAREFEDVMCWLYDVSRKTHLNVKSSAGCHLRRVEFTRDKGIYNIPHGKTYHELAKSLENFEGCSKEIVAGAYGRSLALKRILGITDGRGMLFISHVGDVYPSGFLPLKAGNVREKSLEEIYRESKIFRDLRNPENLKGKCGRCEFKYICGGSRARAYAIFGDYLMQEPKCIYVPKVVSKR
ncbi:TIGR04053 family radical SAM/SPASM domain-containing protein [Archaeoglobus sp.]